MIHAPGLPENVALVVELTSKVVSELPQTVLELLLERVENVVHVAHRLRRLLLVLLDLAAQNVKVSLSMQDGLRSLEGLRLTYRCW